MAALVDTNLVNNTVTYNGVQFGGADSDYESLPPQISVIPAETVYDESRRAVQEVRHILTVKCIFFAANESAMGTLYQEIERLLLQPGKQLKIEGMGTGFGTISNDVNFGPKPLGTQSLMLGPVSWEVVWACEFTTKPCSSQNQTDLAFMAFNFRTTWSNDYEGTCTRRINGHVIIRQLRDVNNTRLVKNVAEETRGNILVVVPAGFRRTGNSWSESVDKRRLDFDIEDEQLPGDVFPPGCTLADGQTSFRAGDGRGGFASSDVSMAMTLKTAPGVARNTAGRIFITAAIAKQQAIQQRLAQSKGVVYPTFINITARKYDDARVTDCSISWHLTSSLQAMMSAAGIWEPLTPSNEQAYNLWKASMDALWDNRGTAGIRSNKDEAVVIDLCDNITSVQIGSTNSNALTVLAGSLPGFSCPNVPEDGGWIVHDLEVKVLVESEQTWHKRAAQYLPGNGQIFPGIGIPEYTQESSDEDVTEYHGYPTVYIGLRFKGLRYKHKPVLPQIKSVGGKPVTQIKTSTDLPKWAFDAFCCPVWYLEGWRIYRVSGYIASVKEIGSPESCETQTVPEDA